MTEWEMGRGVMRFLVEGGESYRQGGKKNNRIEQCWHERGVLLTLININNIIELCLFYERINLIYYYCFFVLFVYFSFPPPRPCVAP